MALADELAEPLLERFDRYCRVATTSKAPRAQSPSTPGQLELARLLAGELEAIGISDVVIDRHGIVYATLEATVADCPTIGLLAHLDTSPDAPGEGVEPLVWRGWNGAPIELPRGGTVVSPPPNKRGETIVTSSGDTLLGADDKAGVAEIVTALAWLHAHPDAPRPRVRVAFTPDEEIGGQGVDLFDIEVFGADCAYTLDGSEVGLLEDETFSAVGIEITVEGVDIHPGSAYGVMVNAADVASRIVAGLPRGRLTPATTRGREGFVHVVGVRGDPVRCQVTAIARDFDDGLLDGHIELVRTVAGDVVAATPGARMEMQVSRQYLNMGAYIAPYPEVVAAAEDAYRAAGVEPVRSATRGGTDGSKLSARGLPTPNLFTGGNEYHSVREWASLEDMATAAAMVVHLMEAWTVPERRGFRLPRAQGARATR